MIEYELSDGLLYCRAEQEHDPFESYLVGAIAESEDGYYRFLPMMGIGWLSCGILKRLAAKLSELNGIESE